MTNERITLAMAHRERGMNVIIEPCRRGIPAFLRVEHGSTLPRLDVSGITMESTVLTKCYYSAMHATGPGVRN